MVRQSQEMVQRLSGMSMETEGFFWQKLISSVASDDPCDQLFMKYQAVTQNQCVVQWDGHLIFYWLYAMKFNKIRPICQMVWLVIQIGFCSRYYFVMFWCTFDVRYWLILALVFIHGQIYTSIKHFWLIQRCSMSG